MAEGFAESSFDSSPGLAVGCDRWFRSDGRGRESSHTRDSALFISRRAADGSGQLGRPERRVSESAQRAARANRHVCAQTMKYVTSFLGIVAFALAGCAG